MQIALLISISFPKIILQLSLSDLAFKWQRGCRWSCSSEVLTDLIAFCCVTFICKSIFIHTQIKLIFMWMKINFAYEKISTRLASKKRPEVISHFRITSSLFFEASLGAHPFTCKSIFIHMKMSLICLWIKIDLHMKEWAPRLASKKRPEVIRKWPFLTERVFTSFSSKQLLFLKIPFSLKLDPRNVFM